MHNLDFNIVHQNLDLYLIPKPRLISFTKIQIKAYTKTQIDIAYQNQNTKTQIYIAHQNLELCSINQNLDLPMYTKTQIYICIPKSRFIQYTKTQILIAVHQNLDQILLYTKTQIYISYQRLISFTKIQIYIYQNLD